MYSLANYFKDKSVTLLGAGVSNMPLAAVLADMCSSLTVRDRKNASELGSEGELLKALGARLITGENYLDGLGGDFVFRSPGMRPDMPELKKAAENGSVITSEMEFFLSLHPCPIYAVTGSDGKSTTTTLVSLMLEDGLEERGNPDSSNVFLGGNIGKPLLDRYPLMKESDAVAVELSSFQLMTIDADIDVAAITNITPNHLNWHTSMEEYIDAKKRILRHVSRAVLNFDNDVTRKIAEEVSSSGGVPITYFSCSPIPSGALRDCDSKIWLEDGVIYSEFPGEGRNEIMKRGDIKLPGLHNVANYMTAAAVTWGKVSPAGIRKIAMSFGGVRHRLEFVRELDGVRYINGSIDSSPTRTAAALSAIFPAPTVLICGGYDKNIPYAPLAEAVYSSSVHTVVLTGATAGKIKAALEDDPRYESGAVRVIENPDFEGAVRDARNAASPGDTVILSPASASFDRFKNFEERGDYFKKLVLEFE